MEKKKGVLTKIALISCGYGIFSDSVIVPIFSKICAEYPDAGDGITGFVLTGGYIFSLIASLITGYMLKKVSARKMLLAGTILFTLGGVGGYFTTSMEFLGFCRILDGLSDGILAVAAISVITALYEGQERVRLIGLYSAVSAGFGVLLSFFSGIIGETAPDWRYCFLLNLISAISIILVFISVPKTIKDTSRQDGKNTIEEKRTILTGAFKFKGAWSIYTEFFVSSALYCILFVFVDIYVQEKSLGSSVLSGSISSLGSILTFVTGVVFTVVYAKVKGLARFLCFFGLGISFIGLRFAMQGSWAVVFYSLASIFYAFLYPYYQMEIGLAAPEEVREQSIGVLNGWYNIACFISAYIPSSIMLLLKMDTVHQTFTPLGSILLAIAFLIRVFQESRKKNN